MPTSDLHCFYLLKQALTKTYQSYYPECKKDIRSLKGQEIVNFQELLSEKVNGRVSEKWFYTHIKPETNQKLPRIDVLNMLSEFVGYRSWEAFRYGHEASLPKETKQKKPVTYHMGKKPVPLIKVPRKWLVTMIPLGIILAFILVGKTPISDEAYTFCFLDADIRTPVTEQIEIFLLVKGESPIRVACNDSACFEYKGEASVIRFAVKSPYYRPDTIVRKLKKQDASEEILLKPDDYALMIHYFSNAKIEDWKKRREQLTQMFTDNAQIIQVDKKTGLEIYNKSEFINKLTIPLKSLKQIEVLETVYENDRINFLRFTQHEKKD